MSHVITRLKGGLGNQLFQYAAGHALASRLNVRLLLDRSYLDLRGNGVTWTPREFELDVFRAPVEFATKEQVAALEPSRDIAARMGRKLGIGKTGNMIVEHGHAWCDEIDRGIASVLLDGYWQNERYFMSVADQLRNALFVPRDMPSPGNLELQQAITATISASVHVRRGDYVADPVTAAYHGALPLKYYEEAAAWLASNKRVEHFFVFTDDPAWTMANLRLPRKSTVVQHNSGHHAHWDLFLMKHCTHHIIANSSFSWWGAWLDPSPSKTVIAPGTWSKADGLSSESVVPSTWMRIPLKDA